MASTASAGIIQEEGPSTQHTPNTNGAQQTAKSVQGGARNYTEPHASQRIGTLAVGNHQKRGKVSVPKRERYQYQNGEGIITKAGPPELPNRKRLYYQKLCMEHLSTEMIRTKVLVSLPKNNIFIYKQQK
jgi:hypothetical protein